MASCQFRESNHDLENNHRGSVCLGSPFGSLVVVHCRRIAVGDLGFLAPGLPVLLTSSHPVAWHAVEILEHLVGTLLAAAFKT